MTGPSASLPPAVLCNRALRLGVMPPANIERLASAVHGDDDWAARMAFDYALAWLQAAPPDLATRERLETSLLRTARQMAAQHAAWGRQALAALVPHLSESHAREARALAQPLLADWRARLIERDVLRTLAPERYADWLRDTTAPLQAGPWPRTRRAFLEWLGDLHVLGREARDRACARAAEALTDLHDDQITADRELGIGGARRYPDDEVRAATIAAQQDGLRALAPFAPVRLHAELRAAAQRAGIDLDAVLGAWTESIHLTHRDRRAWLNHDAVLIPAYTLAEKHTALAALSKDEQRTLLNEAVEGVLGLLDGKRLDNRFGRRDGAVAHVLSLCGPFLDAAQVRAVLARYKLP